jgi:hypothetical protein
MIDQRPTTNDADDDVKRPAGRRSGDRPLGVHHGASQGPAPGGVTR